jgi:hypothetical protein
VHPDPDPKAGEHSLTNQALLWPTPAARDYRSPNANPYSDRGGESKGEQLPNFVEHLWSTPRSSDGAKGSPNQAFSGGGIPLAAQTVNWPTPTNTDAKASRRHGYMIEGNPGTTLHDAIDCFHSSRQDQETETLGPPSSNERRSLNPRFVEWLMGWPPGWTSFECSATASFHYRQRMRSALLSLPLPVEDAPAQLSLLG